MYKQNLELNMICHKTKPNQTNQVKQIKTNMLRAENIKKTLSLLELMGGPIASFGIYSGLETKTSIDSYGSGPFGLVNH